MGRGYSMSTPIPPEHPLTAAELDNLLSGPVGDRRHQTKVWLRG